MTRTLYILLIVVNIGCTAASHADSMLYADPSGWRITTARNCEMLETSYQNTKDALYNQGYEMFHMPGVEYLIKHSSEYYEFIIAPNGHHLLFGADAAFTLFYLVEGDTVSITSSELFFCTSQTVSSLIVPGSPVYPPVSVPNDRVYTSESGQPAVYVRFQFEREPDRLLAVHPYDVHSITNGGRE